MPDAQQLQKLSPSLLLPTSPDSETLASLLEGLSAHPGLTPGASVNLSISKPLTYLVTKVPIFAMAHD